MPRDDLSEERQAQILEAAIREFAQQGFHATRMEDIARASGLSKGAVYLYYKSKDALIAALLRMMMAWELRTVRQTAEQEGSAANRLLRIMGLFADEMDRMAVAMPVMLEFYAVAARQAGVRADMSKIYDEFRAALAPLIQQGVERGEFRPVAAEDVAVTLIALVEGLALLWAMDPHGLNWREQGEAALRLLLDGLRPAEAGPSSSTA